jgi:hypothetical protein
LISKKSSPNFVKLCYQEGKLKGALGAKGQDSKKNALFGKHSERADEPVERMDV